MGFASSLASIDEEQRENEDGKEKVANFPRGVHFSPSKKQLVVYYLMNKIFARNNPSTSSNFFTICSSLIPISFPPYWLEVYPKQDGRGHHSSLILPPSGKILNRVNSVNGVPTFQTVISNMEKRRRRITIHFWNKKYWDGMQQQVQTTPTGQWKATREVDEVIHEGKIVGLKKFFVFDKGNGPTESRTGWMRGCVVCKIRFKVTREIIAQYDVGEANPELWD
ncbi:unnamed protein product [Camellia sinensis]